MNKILFLDRDGVINIDYGHVYRIEDFHFNPGIFELLQDAQTKGYIIVVVTNQGGIGKNIYTEEDMQKLHKWMIEEFAKKGIIISQVYYCPHHPDLHCDCRKPKPKMIFDALRDYNGDAKNSILIGDKTSDVEAGWQADVGRLIYVESKYNKSNLSIQYETVKALKEIKI